MHREVRPGVDVICGNRFFWGWSAVAYEVVGVLRASPKAKHMVLGPQCGQCMTVNRLKWLLVAVWLMPMHREDGPCVGMVDGNRFSGGGLQWSMRWWGCSEVARGPNTWCWARNVVNV